jgi:Predicted transcription factor, homolog of eukaryotic MBF1
MSETTESKNTINQGRNVRFAREFRGISQEDLAHKINKHQSEISKIENQGTVDSEILEQIALALEISADFLKVFDFEDTAKNYYNYSTNTFAETSHDNEVNQAQEIINNFPIDQFAKATSEFLEMQKEHYEKEQQIIIDSSRKDTEIALLKQELEFLKNKK